MNASIGSAFNSHSLTPEERVARRATRAPWWALPTKNTLDRATATFPKLLHERLDQTGIDFAVLYHGGLGAPHIREDELRRATCRAFNTFHADIFREYSDRLTPAAIIPMHTPREAIEEIEHAVKTLGLKVDHDGGACAPSDSRGRRDGAASARAMPIGSITSSRLTAHTTTTRYGPNVSSWASRQVSIRPAWVGAAAARSRITCSITSAISPRPARRCARRCFSAASRGDFRNSDVLFWSAGWDGRPVFMPT